MMPSTEFLLYLVIVIFAVFLIMNYYREKKPNKQQFQYKYIPVYKTSTDEGYDNDKNNQSEYSQSRSYKKNKTCRNPQCMQYGRCICGGNNENINIDINNRSEE